MTVIEALRAILLKHGDFGFWRKTIDIDYFSHPAFLTIVDEDRKMLTILEKSEREYLIVCFAYWGEGRSVTSNLLKRHYALYPTNGRIEAELHRNCPFIKFYPEQTNLILESFSETFEGTEIEMINDENVIARIRTP